MKKLYASLLVCTLLTLALAAPVSAAARVETTVEKQSFAFSFPIYLCNEPVLAEGMEHTLWSATCSDAGVCSLHRIRIIKGHGVGESTGTDYQFLWRTARTVVRNPVEQSLSGEQISIMLIGQGSAENHLLHCVFQRITNAEGEITSFIRECHSNACEEEGQIG
ncbi:MAG: hypothetical protein LUO93_05415 [Methanomicrobiales archaeon]|nr:hypothetical protein [Methanomicrobiales archaeon]